MKKNIIAFAVFSLMTLKCVYSQDAPKEEFKPYGKVTGYAFGDFAYKAHSDSALRGKTQYSQIGKNYSSFNFRRIYLGYDYFISENFSTQLTLAHESGVEALATDPSLASDTKRTVYIKYANLRWKNLIPRAEIVFGQQSTPTFALLSESIWGYRSIEKTIADMRGISSSTDLGIGIYGKFDKDGKFGYDILVANNNGAKIENDADKKVYTSLYTQLFDRKLTAQVNFEYDRTNGGAVHKSRTLYKAFLAYSIAKTTVGVEIFQQIGMNQVALKTANTFGDQKNLGLSIFLKENLLKDKLNAFARFDYWNPDKNYSLDTYKSGVVSERFYTIGFDYTPNKNVHIMPNIWMDQFQNEVAAATGKSKSDYDLVTRLTVHYIFK